MYNWCIEELASSLLPVAVAEPLLLAAVVQLLSAAFELLCSSGEEAFLPRQELKELESSLFETSSMKLLCLRLGTAAALPAAAAVDGIRLDLEELFELLLL